MSSQQEQLEAILAEFDVRRSTIEAITALIQEAVNEGRAEAKNLRHRHHCEHVASDDRDSPPFGWDGEEEL